MQELTEEQQKDISERHQLLIKNNEAQEKLIMQISVLLIGSTLTYSKVLDETALHSYTITGIYLFILTIVCAVLSYSFAQYIHRLSIEEAIKYYADTTDEVIYPDITKWRTEKIRRFLDYSTAIVFCIALVVTFTGIKNQYSEYSKIIKEKAMSKGKDLNESVEPKPIQQKPKPTTQSGTK